jgi:hypothetical protein
MGTTLGIDALFGQAQPFHRPAAHQVLLDNLGGVLRRDAAVPDSLGVHDYRGSVLALVKAAGLVNAHGGSQAGSPAQLLQLGMQFALAIGGAGWTGRIGGTGIKADKDVTLKRWQRGSSSGAGMGCL